MRLELVGAGASYSIKDVEVGYRDALAAQGHQLIEVNLEGRIGVAQTYMATLWKANNKAKDKAPTQADVYYTAGLGVVERALRFMPDWVLIMSGMYLHPDIVIMLKRAGFKVAVILTESPYDEAAEAAFIQFVDVAFTNERASVERLRNANTNTFYLGHAYAPERHKPQGDNGDVPAHDVVFVGTGFTERCETLIAADWSGVDLGLYGQWPYLASRSRLRRYICGGVTDNSVTAALYRRAKIGLNLYRASMGFAKDAPRIDHAESLNPRAVELAAAGCFTISDYRAEVEEVFGSAVPTFKTPAELTEQVRYWLAHDDERQALAAQLPELVQGHTYAARATELMNTLGRMA